MEEKHSNLPPEIKAEDPIAQAMTNFLNFCVQNAKKLLLTGLFLLVAVAGITGFFSWQGKKEDAASTKLGILMLETGRSGNDSQLLADLQKLGGEEASTRTGQIAQLYAARLFTEKGEAASALACYNEALAPLGADPFLNKMILWERAYVHLALGDTQAALSDFSALSAEKSAFQESALYHVFRLEAAIGNREKSEDAHARLLELYPDSFYQLFDV